MKTAGASEREPLSALAARRIAPRCPRWIAFATVALLAAGCATLPPPGADYPKRTSYAIASAGTTALGRSIESAARAHPGLSGFRLLPAGAEALRARAELADAAQKSLDLQYFIIQNDVTGKLLMDAILRAADRGVRVRMLIDDTDDLGKNRQITALAAHPRIAIRIFNPYYSRGPFHLFRLGEFLIDRRLNYRMHNKVFIADNVAAILGGRNIGDEYFAASLHTDFADFDVLALGGIVPRISASFDSYWNSDLAIPVEALLADKPTQQRLEAYRAELEENRAASHASPHLPNLDVPGPVRALLDGHTAVVWAKAEVLYDSPDKIKIEEGEKAGPLLRKRLVKALDTVDHELLIVSPYLVPGEEGMRILERLRGRGVGVQIITNSLASTDIPAAYSGYEHYRVRMLEDGVKLYEVKPSPEAADNHGHSLKPSAGQFSLHAKVFVFDRKELFVGSMNFDYRSLKLNTEIGLLIGSPELARQAGARFDSIAQPANCYIPELGPPNAFGERRLTWRTEENGKPVVLGTEPSGDFARGLAASLLALLPLDDLL